MPSKFSIHTLQSSNIVNMVLEALARGVTVPVVKSVGEISVLGAVKAVSPDTITIARFEFNGNLKYGPTDEGANGIEHLVSDSDFQQYVDFFFEKIERELSVNPESRHYVDYWEIMNEPAPPTLQGWVNLALLNIRLMERAETLGIKLGIFGFNLGQPEWNQAVAMFDTGVFLKAKEGGHILTAHEGAFGGDPIDKWFGDVPPIPDAPSIENAGALAGRYRVLYEGLLKPNDQVIPLVISEAYFRHRLSSSEVVAAVRWYDNLIREDYYVLGATSFTLNPYNENEWGAQWYQHWSSILDYMVSLKDQQNAEEPVGTSETSNSKVFEEYFPLNHKWYDVGNVQVRQGWLYTEDSGANPYSDGQSWNEFYRPPEGVHLDKHLLPPHEHATFLNSSGYCFKLFSPAKPYSVKFSHPKEELMGKYRLTLEFVGDWYIWEGYKKKPEDIYTGMITLYLGGHKKTFHSDEFDLLGPNSLSLVATLDGLYDFGFGVKSNWAIDNNGLFIKRLLLERVEDTSEVPTTQEYKVVYNLLPSSLDKSQYEGVALSTFPFKQTIGFSADDAGSLVSGGRGDSVVVAWNPADIGTGLTQEWFDENYPKARMVVKHI